MNRKSAAQGHQAIACPPAGTLRRLETAFWIALGAPGRRCDAIPTAASSGQPSQRPGPGWEYPAANPRWPGSHPVLGASFLQTEATSREAQ
jgi:hypothetical protein